MPEAFQLDAFQYGAFQLEFPKAFQIDAFQNSAFQIGLGTTLLVPPLYLFQRAVGVAMNKRAIIAEFKPRTFEITIKDK